MASHPKKLRHHWFFASYNKPDVSPLIPDRAKHPILNHFSIILSIVRKDFLKCPISHDGIHHYINKQYYRRKLVVVCQSSGILFFHSCAGDKKANLFIGVKRNWGKAKKLYEILNRLVV